jgi:propionyl-CoA synthetase
MNRNPDGGGRKGLLYAGGASPWLSAKHRGITRSTLNGKTIRRVSGRNRPGRSTGSSPGKRCFDGEAGVYGRWFAGAECNTCYNAVDRHVEPGRGDQAAIIYDSPITGRKRTFTYAELLREVEALAAVLRDLGVEKGDRVLIYMPMVPEAAFAMLASARLGAVHSVVFGGFAAHELATRIDDCQPKVIIAASCGIEPNRQVPYKPMLDAAISMAKHKPGPLHCVLLQREEHPYDLEPGRDTDYAAAVWAHMEAGTKVPCVPVAATDPLYILYTSGTTGQPKGVVRDNGGHMVALPGRCDASTTSAGRGLLGRLRCRLGGRPLLHRLRPAAGTAARPSCSRASPSARPTPAPSGGSSRSTRRRRCSPRRPPSAPSRRRTRRRVHQALRLSSLRSLFLAGERADPDTIVWAQDKLGVPVIDHWWQTETGWAIAGNPLGLGQLPVKIGSPTKSPMPGYDVQMLDDAGHPVPPARSAHRRQAAAAAGLPADAVERRRALRSASYLDEFPGYYKTGDAGYMDEDGYLFIMARTDDIINVAGHRLSTGGMEEVLAGHPDVAECAVIGVADR